MSHLQLTIDGELDQLFERLVEDRLDAVGEARLQEIVYHDDEALRRYLQFMNLHATLNRIVADAPVQSSDVADSDAGSSLAAPSVMLDSASVVIIEEKPSALLRRHKRFDSIHPQQHRFRFSTFSAVLTMLAWAGFGYVMWLSTLPDEFHPNRDGINVNFVAHITGQHEHQWVKSTRGIPPFAFLVPGERLDLVEGLIEITFNDGAKVVLEGPAEFVIDSAGAGTLQEGKLTAYVPKRAVGFTIETSEATVVDLGTEFGLAVDSEDETTDVRVFAGVVDVKPSGEEGAHHVVRLTAGESLRFRGTSLVTLDEDLSFHRGRSFLLRDELAAPLDSALAVWQFVGGSTDGPAPDLQGGESVLTGFSANGRGRGGATYNYPISPPIFAANSDGFAGMGHTDGLVNYSGVDLSDAGQELLPTENRSYSVFARVRYPRFDGVDDTIRVGPNQPASTNYYALQLENGQPRFRTRGDGERADEMISHRATLDVDKWYDLTGVYDSSAQTMTVYVYDPMTGQQVDASASMTVDYSSLEAGVDGLYGRNLLIFESPSIVNGMNTGAMIDLAAIWNLALTPEQVAALSARAEYTSSTE